MNTIGSGRQDENEESVAIKKYKKKELLEGIAELAKSNDLIGRKGSKAAQTELVGILKQCQEKALLLGNALESRGDEASHLVSTLEDYCENVYQMCLSLTDENRCRKLSKRIQKQLAGLRHDIQYDLPDERKEVVFLPYKAAMWDSMESIWKAAAKDEAFDTYVIPLPYFDKNADGSLGQMHDEGNEYPEYVPVTSWKEYSFEEHRPDITVIHNPYDAWNVVTSIHPGFYSERIRHYTDLLVYVPYFVAVADRLDRNFCVLPGTLYADRVIVQSEKVREAYMEELRRFEKDNRCGSAYGDIEKKIVALGSPKYDELYRTLKDGAAVPEAWNAIIRKPGGARKKVVLYNTGITALLKHNEKMIVKIEKVLRTFQEKQHEVALLWRPHPLLSATLQVMRPFLWQDYQRLVEEYRAGNWGIYDDSGDLHRAVCISDLYYGDPSSVVDLCETIGKPIVFQDVDSDEEKICVSVSKLLLPNGISCDGDGKIWFISYGVLYCLDMDTQDITSNGDFHDVLGRDTSVDYFSKIMVVDRKLYFFVKNASSSGIVLFDIPTSTFELLPTIFEKVCREDDPNARLFGCVLFDGNLYFTPFRFGMPLVRLRLAGHEVSYIDDWDKGFGPRWKENGTSNAFSYGVPVLHNEKIVLITAKDNVVFEYDLRTNQSSIMEPDEEASEEYGGNGSICFSGTHYWVTSIDGGHISKYDERSVEEVKLKGIFGKLPENILYTQNQCIYANGFVWVFQRYSDDIIRIDAHDYSMSRIRPDIRPHPDAKWNSLHFFWIEKYNDSILALHCKGNIIIKLDTKSGNIEYLSLEMPAELGSAEWKQLIRYKNQKTRVLTSKVISLDADENGAAGERIYQYIKSLCDSE